MTSGELLMRVLSGCCTHLTNGNTFCPTGRHRERRPYIKFRMPRWAYGYTHAGSLAVSGCVNDANSAAGKHFGFTWWITFIYNSQLTHASASNRRLMLAAQDKGQEMIVTMTCTTCMQVWFLKYSSEKSRVTSSPVTLTGREENVHFSELFTGSNFRFTFIR